MKDNHAQTDQVSLDEYSRLVDDVLNFLDRPGLILFTKEKAEGLVERAAELKRLFRAADDRLCLGLVGGTGVGKSTLINALAGEEISPSSEVRPTTDRLVLYRHRDNSFSLAEDEQVRLHQAGPLERIALADFPDFDSIEPGHRRTLARHFPQLDLLLWVVDPGKYADQAFFDWLAAAPQARVNSVFVFNKIDEYQSRYGPEAGAVLSEVLGDFENKLQKHAGLDRPMVLPLSARQAFELRDHAGQNSGFAALIGLIDDLKEKKRRLAVKELNLAARTRALVSEVGAEADLEKAETGLARLNEHLGRGRRIFTELVDLESRSALTRQRRAWVTGLSAGARDRAPWPLSFFLFIWDRLAGLFSRRPDQEEGPELPQPSLIGLARRMSTWRTEVLHSFGHVEAGPSQNLAQRLAETPDPEASVEAAGQALAAEGLKRTQEFTRRHRWRIRHHILPFLVLAYPYLPLAAAWLWPYVSGQPLESAPAVQLVLGWRDVWPLLLTVVGLYLLETVYFAFSLHRKAGRVLTELGREWQDLLLQMIQMDLLKPVEAFASALAEETAAVKDLHRRAGRT